jgi:hypothetical protein
VAEERWDWMSVQYDFYSIFAEKNRNNTEDIVGSHVTKNNIKVREIFAKSLFF